MVLKFDLVYSLSAPVGAPGGLIDFLERIDVLIWHIKI